MVSGWACVGAASTTILEGGESSQDTSLTPNVRNIF